MQRYFHTTGQFEHLGRGYKRHCGPTAITNIILTMRSRLGMNTPDPQETFLKVAALGKRIHVYSNMDLFGYFGGTSDILLYFYLKKCLRIFGLEQCKVMWRKIYSPSRLQALFRRGSVALLIMRHHPKYKNHDVACYGLRRENGRWYLLLADGWSVAPVWAPADEFRLTYFIEVTAK